MLDFLGTLLEQQDTLSNKLATGSPNSLFIHVSGSLRPPNVTLRALHPGYDGKINTTGGHAADMDAAFLNGDTSHTHNSPEKLGLHVSVGCSHLLHTNGNSG